MINTTFNPGKNSERMLKIETMNSAINPCTECTRGEVSHHVPGLNISNKEYLYKGGTIMGIAITPHYTAMSFYSILIKLLPINQLKYSDIQSFVLVKNGSSFTGTSCCSNYKYHHSSPSLICCSTARTIEQTFRSLLVL